MACGHQVQHFLPLGIDAGDTSPPGGYENVASYPGYGGCLMTADRQTPWPGSSEAMPELTCHRLMLLCSCCVTFPQRHAPSPRVNMRSTIACTLILRASSECFVLCFGTWQWKSTRVGNLPWLASSKAQTRHELRSHHFPGPESLWQVILRVSIPGSSMCQSNLSLCCFSALGNIGKLDLRPSNEI
ncbi:hypothetical protein CONLIGDRAFT_162556 [Coniochaeta ligniaria NRRL 30616]|uniref:Uncharacterized protein n=1 Tax=Coniochaeta ligniaria NRRL 30616 TaxID=1408157 RepID=A0A1J7JIA0_9PEZI|nr:hypothetical protein CONLIGDRAFT_162556 [Coniochaeta ligniaria NRRL 30616]